MPAKAGIPPHTRFYIMHLLSGLASLNFSNAVTQNLLRTVIELQVISKEFNS